MPTRTWWQWRSCTTGLPHPHEATQVFRRIDYQIATGGIASKASAAPIYKEARFSDHAPLIIDYDFTI
jgi:exonuclease III